MQKLRDPTPPATKAQLPTAPETEVDRLRLRLLATTDLHMQLIAYDYVKDRQTGGDSLARLATLIRRAREQAEDTETLCLLVDNGDTLQGSPLGAFLAHESVSPHPMVSAMNALKYDAIGLGNHDFDHGIDHLARRITEFDAPVVCSNICSDRLPDLQPHTILQRTARLASGGSVQLRVGIVSVLPQQTATWNRQHIGGNAHFGAPLPAAKAAARQLKAAGADIVIALAHMGIARFDEGQDAQNQVADIAALPDIDAVVAGHTHLRFPGPDHECAALADCDLGLIADTPVVMPGSGGSDLGVIDLSLERASQTANWRMSDRAINLHRLTDDIREDPSIAMLADDSHFATRTKLARPVVHLQAPMHSYFALASPCPVPAIMAAAKRHAIKQAVAGSAYADLPLLAAAATPATGGFDGPGNFVSLPAGQLEQRHIAGLIPYANHVWAVKANGARLAGWLERSALIFNVLSVDTPDQLLIDPQVPGFRYDAIYGLDYQIDLMAKPRFDAAGRPIAGEKGRVSKIMWQGAPIDPEQDFLVAVTDHRAGGGGTFRPFEEEDIVVREHAPLDHALIEYLGDPQVTDPRPAAPWRFDVTPGVSAILNTAPDALNHLSDIAEMKPEPCGLTPEGFARLRLHL